VAESAVNDIEYLLQQNFGTKRRIVVLCWASCLLCLAWPLTLTYGLNQLTGLVSIPPSASHIFKSHVVWTTVLTVPLAALAIGIIATIYSRSGYRLFAAASTLLAGLMFYSATQMYVKLSWL
jgi:hypothetical protein